MDKLQNSDGSSGLRSRSPADDDFFLRCSDATPIEFVSLSGLDPSSRNLLIDEYDSDDGTRVDAILADVHRIMDCLYVEELDEAKLTSVNLTATQQVQTPVSVDELIFELCGAAGLKEAMTSDDVTPTASSSRKLSSANDEQMNQDENILQLLDRNMEITETNLTSEALVVSERMEQKSRKFYANGNNIKLNLLNTQLTSFKNHQDAPSPASLLVNQAEKSLIRKNGKKRSVDDNVINSVLPSTVERKDTSSFSKVGLKIFKRSKSENSEYFNEKLHSPTYQYQDKEEKPTFSMQRQPPKEKKKLSATLSLPDKSVSIRKVLSPVKRKISSNREPNDSKKLSNDDANCTCSAQLQEENRLRSQVQSSRDTPDEKHNKVDKSVGGTLKKNLWTIEKKLGLNFPRSPSGEERNFTETHQLHCAVNKENQNESFSITLDEESLKVDSFGSPIVLKRRNKVSAKSTKCASVCLEDHNCCLEVDGKKRASASPRLIRQYRLNFSQPLPYPSSPKEQPSPKQIPTTLSKKTFPRVDSEPKLLLSHPNEFIADEEAGKRRRATMDSATTRSRFLDTFVQRKKSFKDEHDDTSLSQKLHQAFNHLPEQLVSRFVANLDSDGSLQGSKDSLEDDETFQKFSAGSIRQGRMKNTINMDEHQVEFLRRIASNKAKKNLLRKSMRYVGKSTSIAAYGSDDVERTWLPEGDCSWRNLSGERVGLESTKLQSLSELECDALRKVSLSRLHEVDLGVSITVPKDESKVLDRKVSIKKRYGVHLSSKEKNKDKNFDHVFGIPLVNVVENDQLLRLQKSASFAPSIEYQQQNDPAESSTGVTRGATLGPPSDTGSSSGSTTSINNHTAAVQDETSISNREINKSTSFEPVNSIDETSKQQEHDNVFNNKDNSSQSQTPTSAKSTGAAQPLRRRGAIAADSINEIDPYQSQLLEALSLSVGGATHNQKKEKKRSLLPPTMVQVPYVVQKCCDHLQKYGLNQAGIFRVPGSKKRVKQLREQFDRGIDVTIDETYNPHDVAALLKEFFRDLPEALLTRELYPAFLQTTKMLKQHERLACLRYLVWLLPLTNRDTLHTLLQFLALVAAHAEDTFDSTGNKIFGNKMTVTNLATIFGPNILHRYKKSSSSTGDGHHYQVQSVEKPEENGSVIKVMEHVISNQMLLFQIPKEEHNQMLRILKESDPEAVDFLLRRKAANHMREKSRLLGSHSSSPNSSRSFPVRHPVGFCEQLPELPTQSDSDCDSADRVERSKTNHVDTNRSAVTRLSYQQATGHAAIPPQEEKHEKGSFHKFKRPFFMKSKSHPSHITSTNCPMGHDNNEESNDVNEITNAMKQLSTGLDKIDASDEPVPTTPMWSTKSSHRSMSFTDDDMEAILGGKSTTESIHDSPEAESETLQMKIDESDDPYSLKQLSDIESDTEKIPSATDPFTDENRSETETIHVIRAANSSDSGVYVDSTKIQTNSASDSIHRRGGFSLEISPDPAFEESCEESSHEKFEVSFENNFEIHSEARESVGVDQELVNNEKRKDSVLENSSDCDVHDHDVSNSLQNIDGIAYDEKSASKLDAESHMKEIHTADNKSAVRLEFSNDPRYDKPSSLLIKNHHPDDAVMIVELEANTNSNSNQGVVVDEKSTNISTFRDDAAGTLSSTQFRGLPTSLHPKVQSQYASTDGLGCLDMTVAVETKGDIMEKQDVVPSISVESEPLKEQSKSLNAGHFRSEKSNLIIRSPKRTSASRGVNVAKLAGRYDKDDKALVSEPKLVPGSKWTSSGLIGTSPNLNDNRKRNAALKGKEYQTPLNNNNLPPWHSAVKGKAKLPETLV